MDNSDVLIVGAGPVGLFLAAELLRHGVRPRIVERRTATQSYSRAIAIQPRTLEVLGPTGLADDVVRHGQKVTRLRIVAGGGTFDARFDDLASPCPFVEVLPQSDTERLFTRHLSARGLEVERGNELVDLDYDGFGADVVLRREGILERRRFGWVVGCDGAGSAVRTLAGLAWIGADETHAFAVADLDLVSPDHVDRDRTWLYVSRAGLCALFPLPGGPHRFRVIADLAPTDPHEVTLDTVRALLRERAGVDARLDHPTVLMSLTTSERLAGRMRVDRVILAGDAAHVHSPVGGQGMNTGIQDAHNLAWKLALVVKGAPPALLDSYEVERRRVAERVVADTHRATQLATVRGLVPQALRGLAVGFLAGYDSIQRTLLGRAAEIDVSYRGSPIVERHGRTVDVDPGEHVADVTWGPQVSLGRLGGMHHLVLLFSGTLGTKQIDPTVLVTAADDLVERFGPSVAAFAVLAAGERPAEVARGARYVIDGAGALHHHLGAQAGAVVALRPDGYLGFAGHVSGLDALHQHLARICGGVR